MAFSSWRLITAQTRSGDNSAKHSRRAHFRRRLPAQATRVWIMAADGP